MQVEETGISESDEVATGKAKGEGRQKGEARGKKCRGKFAEVFAALFYYFSTTIL